MFFGEKLRDRMRARNVSPDDLARAAGSPVKHVHEWIAGRTYPEPHKLLPIAERLHTTLDDLCHVDSWSVG